MWNKLSKIVNDQLIQKEVENLNDPITIKNGDWIVKNSFPRWKDPGDFSADFGQMLILFLFQKTEKRVIIVI